MNLLVLDNYDSFTYNLVQYLEELLERPVTVRRNDAIGLDEAARFDAIVLSPGPGLPAEAGIMPELIRALAGRVPILGVCLGHQAIAEAFGGSLINLADVWHGKETDIHIRVADEALFAGLPNPFRAGRYHSWVVDAATLPDALEVTATDAAGQIMALRHRTLPLHGVQFHPESIMTPQGRQLLANWLAFAKASQTAQLSV